MGYVLWLLRISELLFVSDGNRDTISVFVSMKKIPVFVSELSGNYPFRKVSVFVFFQSGQKISALFSSLLEACLTRKNFEN